MRLVSLTAVLILGCGAAGFAQTPAPKDDALDRLLEKLEGKTPEPVDKPVAPKPADKPSDPKPKADKPAGEAKKDAPKAEPEDKALDDLLEKLGETKEAPKTEGKSQAGEGEMPPKPDAKTEDAAGKGFDEKQKVLDDDLETLTGRVKKKKGEPQQGGGQGQGQDEEDENSPIGQAVKKMREVQQKLGDTDTGEETRKKQGEIVKALDQLIAQSKKQGQGQGKMRKVQQAGNQPGSQPSGQPGSQGNNPGGANPMKPKTPENVAALVGDKNTWGNLPAADRGELENVFKEMSLEKRAELIKRYYESVAKKGTSSSKD